MEKLLIGGGNPLAGRVRVSGAKNAVLPIIAATLLTEEKCCIHGVPMLADVRTLTELISFLGADLRLDGETLTKQAGDLENREAPYEYVSKMRASFLVMGPLLARFGRARVSMPGGCNIGTRPIDLHLKGFTCLGAKITRDNGFVEARAEGGLIGARVYLDFPSVGATENIMLAAALAEGVTRIHNAAEEPEISDLAVFLNSMGAQVSGAGTNLITIRGVRSLHGATHTVIPDRVEAGTYMVAAALTGGEIEIENVVTEHLKPVIAKIEEAGAIVKNGGPTVRVTGPSRILPVNIHTLPYPGFPTDMQPQMTSLLTLANGTSMITETVFENRYMHVEELIRMGADIRVDGRVAMVKGVQALHGAQVRASDLRGGAALLLAGLAARGTTEISLIHHIDRGYERVEEKLRTLGADIQRMVN